MRYAVQVPTRGEFTFADVFLLPQDYQGGSRHHVDLTPDDPPDTRLPLVSADMLAVTGRRVAETMARRGGLGVFSHDLDEQYVGEAIRSVKSAHPVWETAPTVSADASVTASRHLAGRFGHGQLVVTDGQGDAVGAVSELRLLGAEGHTRVGDLAEEPMTLSEDTDPREAFLRMTSHGAAMALVRTAGRAGTVATPRGAIRSMLFPPALDARGRLLTAVAVGMTQGAVSRAKALIEHGADVVVLHTPHAAQEPARRTVAALREALGDRTLVAGVAVTGEATEALIGAGTDVVKVGLGGGAMCTTRMMTAVGRPQFSAIVECAEVARGLGRSIWSDGGVRHPRDVVLALAAGASSVMVGSWFSRTLESPPPLMTGEDGQRYKECFGIASRRAVGARSSGLDPVEQALASYFEEGISNSRLRLDPERLGLEDVIDHIAAGLRSGCTYTGATSLPELRERAVVGVHHSAAGYAEGAPLPQGW
ncbi:IMP dehydrogenase [Streptomyces rochei]|uniref:IMP dehydrogenase n=1 Tax=Streptomyces TaxID=1883 RepID=UPI000F77E368|nr:MULTISPECIES: IMP dehydrogenase [unclassified Streptomyces]NUV95697.1 GuaB1 family IMP dehydrogenase-related protein [Streptomyces sp. KAI 90]QCR45394.1 GuaB1 family IMP dehydrogenase-related protein [Streptomyces sp. SGAir0924]RSS18174.1 GuaB1 family IMP dehydrogenase-related protein [Streptomyces sp. WAC05458]RSS97913.1 GuaB1 family IMP dehydrogenase-related protein [Streptomyces sp. WAC02707]